MDTYEIIKRGINFLAQQQQNDGSFFSLASSSPDDFQNSKKCPAVFSSTLILQNLNEIATCHKINPAFSSFDKDSFTKTTPLMPNFERCEIKNIQKKIADFLIKQKSENWTFNYWARGADESKNMPYPDDMDDTSCALAALYKYNPKIIDGNVLGKFVLTLTSLEEKEGGPYRTWLVGPNTDEIWQKIDLAVNSNIAYFLSLIGVELENLKMLIENNIVKEEICSPYYKSYYPIVYFISRFYNGNKKNLIDFILNKKNKEGYWENPLNTSLAILALLNLGYKHQNLDIAINYIKECQHKSWGWDVYPFYTGIKNFYAGSEALTTAYCIYALSKYDKLRVSKEALQIERAAKSEDDENFSILAKKNLHERLQGLQKELFLECDLIMRKILKTDNNHPILSLPYLFKKFLGDSGYKISDEICVSLGIANIYGWMAYSVYDDFLDEKENAKYLSAANFFLRELTLIFADILPRESGFYEFFKKIMIKLDAANAWEITHCRIKKSGEKFIIAELPAFEDYSKLADRSFGHALGPLAIMFSLGYTESSKEFKNISVFFKNYIIARQLNDDAHDWQEDLKKGQVNSASAKILGKWKEISAKNEYDLKDISDFEKIFWYEIVEDFCNEVLRYVAQAKEILFKNSFIEKPEILEKLLEPIMFSAKKAISERAETIKFLKAFG